MKCNELFAILLALALSACASERLPLGGASSIQVIDATNLPPPALERDDLTQPIYRIGAFDELDIAVYGVKDLERKVQVDASGDIVFPLAGRVTARGLTPFELSELIAQRLRDKFIRDPQVSVNLIETVSQVVTVDGQVKEPGLYPVVGPMTLMQAVARAKGTTEYAKLEDVVIFREVNEQRYVALYNLAMIRRGSYEDPRIFPGDIVVVGDTPKRRLMRDIIAIGSIIATPIIALIQGM